MSLVGRKESGLSDFDIDELVDHLNPDEIQQFLDDCDPDDPDVPAALRCSYKCDKESTGPFNQKQLLEFIEKQALNTPDVPDRVPFVPATVRGKKWNPMQKPKSRCDQPEASDLESDVDEALSNANSDEIANLAGILGLYSIVNQEQYHSSQSEKWAHKPDPSIGIHGVTKCSPLKSFPEEMPNLTKPEDIIDQLKRDKLTSTKVNLNNVHMSQQQFLALFETMSVHDNLTELHISNTSLSDKSALALARVVQESKKLSKLSLESNLVSPQVMVKLFEAANIQQVLVEIKASNQLAKVLGNKVETAITSAIEKNRTILKVGLHFQFGDCRNRVAVHLQKNMDRLRLKRVGLQPQKAI